MEPGQVFCGVKENEFANATMAKWPTGACTYGFNAYLGVIGREAQLRLTALAWSKWMSVCGVKISKSSDPSLANIQIGASRQGEDNQFDGQSGVLAYCGLPMPGTQQVPLMFDLDESWDASDPSFHPMMAGIAEAISPGGNPTIQEIVAGIQYFFVVLHEGGHGLGLSHAAQGSANVMAPIYNPNVVTFGAWEKAEMVKRYGPAVPVSPPTPGTGTDVSGMRVLIGTDKYRLVKE